MSTSLTLYEDLERGARRVLPRFVFDYVSGGADGELCVERNRRDLNAVTLAPRVLRNTSHVDTSIKLFGTPWCLPMAVGPTGLNGLVRPDGDIYLAIEAARNGIPFTLSTASTTRIEDIRKAAPDGELWLQLYVLQDRTISEQLLRRARAASFRVLVLTVDVPVSGYRTRDLRNGFALPLRPNPHMAMDLLRRPAWTWRQLRHGFPTLCNLTADRDRCLPAQAQAALLNRTMDRSLDWRALDWLRSRWDGPILIKGVLHPDDAVFAIDAGADGVIVSNHGGRQCDLAPSAISVMPSIVKAVDGRIPVLFDSGIHSGTDIVRALSCGAAAVLIGRPLLYGLAVGGRRGVAGVLSHLATELERNMTLLGVTDVRAVNAMSQEQRSNQRLPLPMGPMRDPTRFAWSTTP